MPSHTLSAEEYEDASPWITDILWLRNHYRSQLPLGHLADFPATGNMLEMLWNKLAEVVQALAERCSSPEGIVSHDRPEERTTPTFFKVGQNLFSERGPFATMTVTIKWHFIVRHWFDENYLYSSSKAEKYEAVKGTTYFTQVAWARSYVVGCYFTYNFVHPNVQEANDPNEGVFRTFIYVLNYAPAGNVIEQDLNWPGPPCSHCPEGTVQPDDGSLQGHRCRAGRGQDHDDDRDEGADNHRT
ncbi:hypothetical protein V5799_000536 [Amblyomma americanum]|uniref:SCP domain-containing protein n=1 Tax=Amblyomma americanum TaxID=6943 RepID=A0AAQ4D2S8_AMBAM